MDTIRMAIPVFNGRISPVLDACTQIGIFDYEQKNEVKRHTIWVDGFSLSERLANLEKLGVNVIICCGISDVLHKLLKSKNIRVIAGRIGEIEEVVDAFFCNQLDNECFLMPGYSITNK